VAGRAVRAVLRSCVHTVHLGTWVPGHPSSRLPGFAYSYAEAGVLAFMRSCLPPGYLGTWTPVFPPSRFRKANAGTRLSGGQGIPTLHRLVPGQHGDSGGDQRFYNCLSAGQAVFWIVRPRSRQSGYATLRRDLLPGWCCQQPTLSRNRPPATSPHASISISTIVSTPSRVMPSRESVTSPSV
jgi:hypothetical protein